MPTDLDRRMHEHPANQRLLAYLAVGRQRLRPWNGLGFDEGGVALLDDYGRALPGDCKWSLGAANLMLHPATGVIFAVHHGRFTFLLRSADASSPRRDVTETLDGPVDLRSL